MGIAMIDKGRCLPMPMQALHCLRGGMPDNQKAIWLEDARVKDRSGKEIIVKQPQVDLDSASAAAFASKVSCARSRPAIYVFNTGESRSKRTACCSPENNFALQPLFRLKLQTGQPHASNRKINRH